MRVGYTQEAPLVNHLLFPLSHANIFHLLCNAFALLCIKGRLHLTPALTINLIASFLPNPSDTTYGISGVICAIMAIKWGTYFRQLYNTSLLDIDTNRMFGNIRRFCLFYLLPLFICAFLPNVNWLIHFYSFTLGITYSLLAPYHDRK